MSSLPEACGATGPLVWAVERRGSTAVERFTFDQPYLVVGRDPRADLHLPHPEVSDRHAYFQLIDGRLHGVDLGSRTGVYYDGRRRRDGWIDPGASIRIGPYRLRLVAGDRPAGCKSAADPDSSSPLTLTLALSHRSISPTSFSLNIPLILIGSASDCHAALLDPAVAPVHAALISTPRGCWVLDLLGPGGVALNGETMERLRPFAEGDELRIGASLVQWPAPAPTTPPRPDDASPTEPADVNATLLDPLTRRFELMQQQMFDRLQESERQRHQALIAFQGEQFALLHEELEQLRELRQELDELRAELRVERRSASGSKGSKPPAASASGGRPRLGSTTTPTAPHDPQGLPAAESTNRLRIERRKRASETAEEGA